MSRKKRIIGLFIILVLITGIGYLIYMSLQQSQNQEAVDNADSTTIDQQNEEITQDPEVQDQVALSDAKEVVAKHKDDPSISNDQKTNDYIDLAASYSNTNQSSDAVATLEDALEQFPENKSQIMRQLIYAYYENDERQKAIDTAEELIVLRKEQEQTTGAADPSIEAIQNTLDRLKAGEEL